MHNLDLEAMKEICNRASPGPWNSRLDKDSRHRSLVERLIVEENSSDGTETIATVFCGALRGHGPSNANFIACAREDMPRLIEALEESDKKLTPLECGHLPQDLYCEMFKGAVAYCTVCKLHKELKKNEDELERLENIQEKLLFDLYKAPRIHAYTREAFVAMVSTIIICAGIENFSPYDFYTKHLGTNGSSYTTPTDLVDNEWARMVIDYARDILLRIDVVKGSDTL